jgi:cytochrome c oxidase subunit 1
LDWGLFDPARGGDPVLYQHLFWFYSHPAVYIMILPAMGVISEVVPTFSHKNPSSYKAIVYSTIGIAFVGFGTWGHHMFVAGMSMFDAGAFGVLSMLVAVFSAIKVFTWTFTMRKGAIAVRTPLLYFFAFLFLFVFGGMTGVAVATQALDVHWHDTYFVVAHFHFVMVGGTLTAWLAALHYWFPKLTGRMYPERAGYVGVTLVFAGFFMTFFPQFLLGNGGMPRRYYYYDPTFQPLHVVSTVGAWILGFAMLWTLGYLLLACFTGPRAGDNPWDSRSYEWFTSSPPPKHNFADEPRFALDPYDYTVPAERMHG